MNLKTLRVNKGLKLKDVADALGVARSTVSLWETGKRKCSVDILLKLKKLYKVSFEKITAAYQETQGGVNNG